MLCVSLPRGADEQTCPWVSSVVGNGDCRRSCSWLIVQPTATIHFREIPSQDLVPSHLSSVKALSGVGCEPCLVLALSGGCSPPETTWK